MKPFSTWWKQKANEEVCFRIPGNTRKSEQPFTASSDIHRMVIPSSYSYGRFLRHLYENEPMPPDVAATVARSEGTPPLFNGSGGSVSFLPALMREALASVGIDDAVRSTRRQRPGILFSPFSILFMGSVLVAFSAQAQNGLRDQSRIFDLGYQGDRSVIYHRLVKAREDGRALRFFDQKIALLFDSRKTNEAERNQILSGLMDYVDSLPSDDPLRLRFIERLRIISGFTDLTRPLSSTNFRHQVRSLRVALRLVGFGNQPLIDVMRGVDFNSFRTHISNASNAQGEAEIDANIIRAIHEFENAVVSRDATSVGVSVPERGAHLPSREYRGVFRYADPYYRIGDVQHPVQVERRILLSDIIRGPEFFDIPRPVSQDEVEAALSYFGRGRINDWGSTYIHLSNLMIAYEERTDAHSRDRIRDCLSRVIIEPENLIASIRALERGGVIPRPNAYRVGEGELTRLRMISAVLDLASIYSNDSACGMIHLLPFSFQQDYFAVQRGASSPTYNTYRRVHTLFMLRTAAVLGNGSARVVLTRVNFNDRIVIFPDDPGHIYRQIVIHGAFDQLIFGSPHAEEARAFLGRVLSERDVAYLNPNELETAFHLIEGNRPSAARVGLVSAITARRVGASGPHPQQIIGVRPEASEGIVPASGTTHGASGRGLRIYREGVEGTEGLDPFEWDPMRDVLRR